MEQNAPDSLFDLQVDYDSGNFLKETSKWTKFISIVSFVGIGMILCVILFAGSAMMAGLGTMMPGYAAMGAALGAFVLGIILVALAIGIFLSILLYQFATFTKRGIEQQDQVTFNKGLKSLKNYFIIYGVVMILSLTGNFISFLVSLT